MKHHVKPKEKRSFLIENLVAKYQVDIKKKSDRFHFLGYLRGCLGSWM